MIVAKLEHLDSILSRIGIDECVKNYLNQALLQGSEINNRICNINSACESIVYLDNGIRAIEQGYYLKSPQNAFFETHRKFVDLQLVVCGYEYFSIGDKDEFEIKVPYNEQKDLIVYENIYPHCELIRESREFDCKSMRTSLKLSKGYLAIFFPNDVHAGGLELDSKKLKTSPLPFVKKSVLKVPLDLFRI